MVRIIILGRETGQGRGTYFESKDFGLHEGERFAVHFDETFASLNNEGLVVAIEGAESVC